MLKLFKYKDYLISEKGGINIFFDYQSLNNGYSLGLGELTLYFTKDPKVGDLENLNSLTFGGLYDNLKGEYELTFYKILNPKFIRKYNNNDINKVLYEFKVGEVIKLSSEQYNELKNKSDVIVNDGVIVNENIILDSYHGHKIPSNEIFKHDNIHTDGYNRELENKIDIYINDESFEKHPQEYVKVENIVPTQKYLNKDNLKKVEKSNPHNDTGAYLVEYNNLYYVIDGHHRIANQIIKGVDIIKAYVGKVINENRLLKTFEHYKIFLNEKANLNKKVTIKLDNDVDSDNPYIIYGEETYSIPDFIEYLNNYYNLKIDYTFDDSFYNGWYYQYLKELEKIEEEFGDLEWEEVEELYNAYAQESINWFEEKFEDLEEIDITVEYEKVSNIEPHIALGNLREELESKKYWHDFEEIKDELEERMKKLGYDFSEFYKILKNNFDTKGKASRSLLGEDGLLQNWIEEDFDLDEEEPYDSYNWDEIKNLIEAMNVARKRHLETDYDSIDKSKLSDEEVKSLRKFYNK